MVTKKIVKKNIEAKALKTEKVSKIVKKPAAKSVSKTSPPKKSEAAMSEIKRSIKPKVVVSHQAVKGNRIQTAERARREMLKMREK